MGTREVRVTLPPKAVFGGSPAPVVRYEPCHACNGTGDAPDAPDDDV